MKKRIPAITQKQVAAFIKPRAKNSHKGMFGTVAVIGGESGMLGAALLAGRAALKLGAGAVHIEFLAPDAPAVDVLQPELMLHSAHAKRAYKPDVIAAGCGMGISSAALKILYDAIKSDAALVLDADALNMLARQPDLQDDLRARTLETVITPHPGEAARLLGTTTAEVQAGRINSAIKLAEKFQCAVVLKGANSVCITKGGKTYLNNTGNPGMSAPGMGDVLTGMIAAFCAQRLDADDALLLAAYLHGAAGDALAAQGVKAGMTASELTDWARWILNQWQK